MNLTALYLETKARYLQAPTWQNYFALLGALLLKWPALTKKSPQKESFDEPSLYRDKEVFESIVRLLKEGGGKVILIKPNLPEETKSFVLAHELGHHLLGHIDQGCRIENWLQEIHADVFATWLSDVNSPWRSREEQRWIRKIIGTGPTRGRTRGSLAPRSSFEFRTQNFDVIH